MSEETREEQERRTWIKGNDGSFESINAFLLSQGIEVPEGKTLDADLLARALQRQSANAPKPVVKEVVKEVEKDADTLALESLHKMGMSEEFIGHVVDVAHEQNISISQMIAGHLVTANDRGELNAPARDASWVVNEETSGSGLENGLPKSTYMCQSPKCKQHGLKLTGRRGQKYCSNVCYEDHHRMINAEKKKEHTTERQNMIMALLNRMARGHTPITEETMSKVLEDATDIFDDNADGLRQAQSESEPMVPFALPGR